jgi:hypothetical protein
VSNAGPLIVVGLIVIALLIVVVFPYLTGTDEQDRELDRADRELDERSRRFGGWRF